MSSEFIAYAAITLSAWTIALLIVKPRNAFDLRRCGGWYLLVFFATYILRPATSELTGDHTLYQLLKLGSFEDHWQLMATAVPLAIIPFAIGYAIPRPRPAARVSDARTDPVVDPHKVRVLIYCLIFWGYFAALISAKTGTMAGDSGDYADVSVGVYEHSTAWFAEDDLFVSSASILYYILTGSLGMSLLLAAPWFGLRIIYGWGRSHLLGHFFALMAIYFIKAGRSRDSGISGRQVLFIGSAVLVVLMLFPLLGMMRSLKAQLHLSSTAVSTEALSMVKSGADPAELLQTYLGTNSSISGFETTLSHLLNDPRCDLGTQYLYWYVIRPVPRIIWPGKGTPYTWPEKLRGIEVDPLMGLIGAAPGSIGMAYEEWGWLGIPLEFLLTGWLLRKAEEAALRRSNALHVQLGYAGLYAMLPQLGRDSLIYMVSSFWLFQYGIPVFILWRIAQNSRKKVRSRSSALTAVKAPAISGLTG